MATGLWAFRFPVSPSVIDKPRRSVLIMVANPIGKVPVRASLIMPFRSQVEQHVRAHNLFVAARVAGVRVEDIAAVIFVKHAEAR
jgi:hypothetical protein